MAIYHVGQRVRVIKNLFTGDHPIIVAMGTRGMIASQVGDMMVGKEGVIAEIDRTEMPYPLDVLVRIHELRGVIFHTDELEPILYDGANGVEWEGCVWHPETEEVEA